MPPAYPPGQAGGRSLLALAVVAAGYLVAQFLVLSPRTFLGPDESLYYSQFARHVPAGQLGAPRAWGVPLLAAPVTAVTDSVIVLRLYLGTLSAAGLFLAFWPWHRLRPGPVVPVAAFLFASLWVSLFYGPELMPNLPGALCAVAAVGLFVHATGHGSAPGRRRRWPALLGIVVALGLMSLLRPTESLPIVLPLLAAGIVLPRRRRVGPPAAVLLGTAIGWAAWSVEAWIRFGGLAARLAQNDHINDVGWQVAVLRHLQAFASTTQLCNGSMPECGEPTLPAVLIWSAIPPCVAAGLWAARQAPYGPAFALATVVGVSAALPYFFYTALANPRFLLVTYALLALPVAEAVVGAAARHPAVRAVVIVTLAGFCAHQFAVAHAEGAQAQRSRARHVLVAHRLEKIGLRRPCLVYGTGSWQVAVATGCRSLGDRLLRKVHPPPARIRQILDREAANGTWVAIVSSSRRRSGDPVTTGLRPRPLGAGTSRTAYLLEPGSGPVPWRIP